MVKIALVGRVRRRARAGLVLAAALVGASCSDGPSLGPIAPGHARLALAPRFALVAGAPTIPLSRIEGSLTSPAGDSTFAKANFVEGEASLTFDVRLSGESADFVLDLVGFDANGNEAYRAHQIYRIKPGLNDDLDQPVLQYSAPDSKAVALLLTAQTATLDPGGTTRITVAGIGPNEAPITPIRVGFTARNTDVATVDDAGNVSAKQVKGATYIVARTPANLADSILITTRGAVAQIVADPTSLSIFRGASSQMTVRLTDPAGTVITDRPVTFTSSDEKVATVTATGLVRSVGLGTANITATSEGKSVTVPVTVVTPVASITVSPDNFTLTNVGATQFLTVTMTPKPGASTTGLTPTFTSSDATVATVSAGGTVTAVKSGAATITAAIDGLSATASVSVVTGLTVTPGTAEKLPNGTQQFTVSGGNGPFTWQVNGVTGGNATFGTISATGFYTAPAAVPQPASFDVCVSQESPAFRGCARVTINPIPTSGADVIVFNDINSFDEQAAQDPNNIKLFKNLVDYTGPGPRATQTGVLLTCGHSSATCATGPTFASTLANAGYTMTTTTDATIPIPIPSNVKMLILSLPRVSYSNDEINTMKQFSAEGGRILYIGEYDTFLGVDGLATENDFFVKMGAVMRNAGSQIDCGYNQVPAANLRPHQVTTGMTGLTMGCASEVILGPNDYPIYVSLDTKHVLAAVAKVDVTPLPPTTPPANRVPAAARMNRTGKLAPVMLDPVGRDLVPRKTP